MYFKSMSEKRRITLQLKDMSTANLQAMLMLLQDEDPSSSVILVIHHILGERSKDSIFG